MLKSPEKVRQWLSSAVEGERGPIRAAAQLVLARILGGKVDELDADALDEQLLQYAARILGCRSDDAERFAIVLHDLVEPIQRVHAWASDPDNEGHGGAADAWHEVRVLLGMPPTVENTDPDQERHAVSDGEGRTDEPRHQGPGESAPVEENATA